MASRRYGMEKGTIFFAVASAPLMPEQISNALSHLDLAVLLKYFNINTPRVPSNQEIDTRRIHLQSHDAHLGNARW
jgi:hypothetical protein